MRFTQLRQIGWWTLFAILLLGTSLAAATRLTLAGPGLPSALTLGESRIVTGSDSLLLNDSLLVRGVDYVIDYAKASITLKLASIGATDTLHIRYTPIPAWLERWYGREVPDVSSLGVVPTIPSDAGRPAPSLGHRGSGVRLAGTKSFRFSARSAGSSEFSQSLSLTIAGELSPGVEISGAISDRGFDPTYGTLNSRLSELDKVNIRLTSQRVLAQLGDISVTGLPNQEPSKEVKGASATVRFPHWHASATAARPRGRFESVRLSGANGYQGPYQISTPTAGQAIVPNSETVWLDGITLERGANKDYVVDYPAGQITFNVNHPIDARSRIEIDFEPLTVDYKGELFAGSGGFQIADSGLYVTVGVAREGDDQDAPEAGELSENERILLENAGDTPVQISGVRADTSGNYLLDAFLLPDTVWRYAGEGNGDYSISFSFVGRGKGTYRFLGGPVYEYAGSANGDYAPVVLLTSPQRTDHYQIVAGSRSDLLGVVQADIRQTRFDRNLFSARDDADNDALYYDLTARRELEVLDRLHEVTLRRRQRDATFVTRQRLDAPDFARTYMIPEGFTRQSVELLHEGSATLSPDKALNVRGLVGNLDYERAFSSRMGGVEADWFLTDRLAAKSSWRSAASSYNAGGERIGEAETYRLETSYGRVSGLRGVARFEHDRRSHNYRGPIQGTRYDRLQLETRTRFEYLRWERHLEDSLLIESGAPADSSRSRNWNRVLARDRLTAGSQRRLGRIDYDLSLSYQWLRFHGPGIPGAAAKENSFLGRLNLRYDVPRQRFSVSSSYVLSEEVRNARGIAYVEVEPGQGTYVLEDGRYVPDPDGNFIQVEEILSDQARVRRGEKSFNISRDFRTIVVRFSADVSEELLPEGNRSALWVLPFYSDAGKPYLFFSRRYFADIKLIPVAGFHVISLAYSEDLEQRRILASDRRRTDRDGKVTIREHIRETYFEQSLQLFQSNRDAYFSGGARVDGYNSSAGVRQVFASGEVSGKLGYRRATDDAENRSETYSLTGGSRIRLLSRGELRATLEYYRQQLNAPAETVSYQLTANNPGNEGVNWSLGMNYGVRGGLRLNVSLSGRHADNRTARITGRGEVVAAL